MNEFRKLLCLVVSAVLLLSLPGLAYASNESVITLEEVSLDDALLLLEVSGDEDSQELYEELSVLKRCSGVFVQERTEGTGKAYSATVEFFLRSGVPYCQVNYSNYMGTIGEAPVELRENEPYLLHTEPIGTLYSRKQQFAIDIGEEDLHIVWGDACDYHLTRGSGAAVDYENITIPFVETEEYANIVEAVDNFLKDVPHHNGYDEGSRTFYTWFQAKEGLYQAVLLQGEAFRDSVNSLAEGLVDMSAKLGTYMSLAVRDGGIGSPKGHYSVILVDRLNDEDIYEKGKDIIFEVQDGKIIYNLTESTGSGSSTPNVKPSMAPVLPSAPSKPSSTYTTMGQRNALQRAKEYLDFTAFSYTGLIEQLEYEGYSHSEAQYAADHCGADWNRQAAIKAKQYLEFTSFSRQGLIEQLEYEGFTHSQAVYGVTQNGY